jgi:hypothetical protein
MSVPAEKERARNWEERKQQSNWAQSRPTHGSEMSPNRTHNNTQGNHEVRALQQPPNAAHAERAISKHAPSLYKVPTYSTRAGARHGGGNRAVTSQPRTGQSTSYGDVKSSYGGGRRLCCHCLPCARSPIPSILVPCSRCSGCLSCLAVPLLLVCCARPCPSWCGSRVLCVCVALPPVFWRSWVPLSHTHSCKQP